MLSMVRRRYNLGSDVSDQEISMTFVSVFTAWTLMTLTGK